MSAAAQHLEEWHGVLGDPQDASTCYGAETADLRKRLITEEYKELMEAIDEGDVAHIAKELSDLLYVLYGTARAYDFSPDHALAEVHRSNMTKLIDEPVRLPGGKLTKGPHYEEADMAHVIATTTWKDSLYDIYKARKSNRSLPRSDFRPRLRLVGEPSRDSHRRDPRYSWLSRSGASDDLAHAKL